MKCHQQLEFYCRNVTKMGVFLKNSQKCHQHLKSYLSNYHNYFLFIFFILGFTSTMGKKVLFNCEIISFQKFLLYINALFLKYSSSNEIKIIIFELFPKNSFLPTK